MFQSSYLSSLSKGCKHWAGFLPFPFLFSLGSQPLWWSHPHSGWVSLPQLILNTLTTYPVVSHSVWDNSWSSQIANKDWPSSHTARACLWGIWFHLDHNSAYENVFYTWPLGGCLNMPLKNCDNLKIPNLKEIEVLFRVRDLLLFCCRWLKKLQCAECVSRMQFIAGAYLSSDLLLLASQSVLDDSEQHEWMSRSKGGGTLCKHPPQCCLVSVWPHLVLYKYRTISSAHYSLQGHPNHSYDSKTRSLIT